MMRVAATALLLSLTVSACAPMAVVGAAVVVNDEFVDNAQVASVEEDVDFVWPSVKSTMTHMTTDLIEVDDDLRALRTYVEGAQVTVQVERQDVARTRVRVAAKKLLVYNDEVARRVLERILGDLR